MNAQNISMSLTLTVGRHDAGDNAAADDDVCREGKAFAGCPGFLCLPYFLRCFHPSIVPCPYAFPMNPERHLNPRRK